MKKTPAVKDIGFAKLDFARRARTGFGETVFGPGKTPEQMVGIFRAFREKKLPVLATRCTAEQAEVLAAAGVPVRYDPVARAIASTWGRNKKLKGRVAVLTGGTADIPVAEEAAQSAEFFGATVDRFFDVGVAGLHRLLSQLESIRPFAVPMSSLPWREWRARFRAWWRGSWPCRWWRFPLRWDTAWARAAWRPRLRC